MTASSLYSTRPAALPDDRDQVLGVWLGSLGERERMQDKFHWFYERSPTGMPLAMLLVWRQSAEAPPQVIGVASAGRRNFLRGSQSLAAGVLVDMAVRPEHRTLGPALQLQKSLLAEGQRDLDFLYGFPNPKAAPVFQRVGYRRLGTMQRFVRVLRASGYLTGRMPAWIGWLAAPLADVALRIAAEVQAIVSWSPGLSWGPVDALGEVPAAAGGTSAECLAGDRSTSFLAWRFASTPAGAACSGVIASHGSGKVYWVVEDQGKVLQVRDCSARLLDPDLEPAWRALFRDAGRRGFHSVSFECLAAAKRLDVLRSLGMTVRSERPVFWSGFKGANPQEDVPEFFLTSADEDE